MYTEGCNGLGGSRFWSQSEYLFHPEHMEKYGSVIDPGLQVEWVIDSVPNAGPIEAILGALTDPSAMIRCK